MTQRQKLEDKLDDIVREIIHTRDDGNPCITCGSRLPLTAGHYIKRRHLATRWNLDNVHGQCWECNSKDDDQRYRDALVLKLGEDVVLSLEELGHKDVKLANFELSEMLDYLNDIKKMLNGQEKTDEDHFLG